MRLAIMLEPQEGLTYDDQLAVARRSEALGLAGVYRSDHYSSVAGATEHGSTDAWAALAGLARDTSVLTLGTLVSPVTFRPAGNLAKVVATVAQMAGATPDGRSRIRLGMGTGWLETEHRQYGFAFEDVATRFARLEEHLQAVTALWDPQRDVVDLQGRFVTLQQARFRPKPQPRPDVIVGGSGLRRTPQLAARYAGELNGVMLSPERCAQQRAALLRACEDAGRGDQIAYSLMTGCLVGATDAEFRARVRRLRERTGDNSTHEEFVAARASSWVLGTPEQAAERLGALADAGVEQVMLQHLLHDDLDMIDLIAGDIAPRL